MKNTKCAKYADGWNVICGYDVYIEDGCVLRGTKKDHNGSYVTAYPYVKVRDGWDNAVGIAAGKFQGFVKRGIAILA